MASTFKGQTGEITEVKLTSAIERVMWTRLMAAPGAEVGLEIFTRYVGTGAPLEITLSDQTGKKHGTYRDKVYANRFASALTVPEKASGALIAEVKLPKHGLSASTPALLLAPPIRIENLKWSAAEARRGDVLTISADVRGAPDGAEAEISIWEHDADGAHDPVSRFSAIVRNERVEAEWEFEYVEDTDDIPTDEELEAGYQHPEYFFRVSVYGVVADSDLLRFLDWIEIEMSDPFGAAMEGEPFIAHLPDGSEKRGKLDAAGRARLEDVPPGPYAVEFPAED